MQIELVVHKVNFFVVNFLSETRSLKTSNFSLQVRFESDNCEVPRDAAAAVPLHDDGLRHRRRHLHRRRHHRLLPLLRHRDLQKV